MPSNTRLPPVLRVPPFQGEACSWRQASFCFTGSQATRRPKGWLVGGSLLILDAVFQPTPLMGWPGLLLP